MRLPLLTAASVALFSLAAPRIVAAQHVGDPRHLALDSLSARLVATELERLSSKPGDVGRGSLTDIDAQITALHDRLRELPEGASADREAISRVVLALVAREYEVRAKLQAGRSMYVDKHPIIQELQSEQSAIDQRLSEIRRSI